MNVLENATQAYVRLPGPRPGRDITCWPEPRLGKRRQVPKQPKRPQQEQRREPGQQREREPVRLPSCRKRPERKRRSGKPAGWNSSCESSKQESLTVTEGRKTLLNQGQPRKPSGRRIRRQIQACGLESDKLSATAPTSSITDIRVNTDTAATNPAPSKCTGPHRRAGSTGRYCGRRVGADRPDGAAGGHPRRPRETPRH